MNCSTLTRVELHASRPGYPRAPAVRYCSTLTRVELHASPHDTRAKSPLPRIAVPSHGSNFMHHTTQDGTLLSLKLLQYPHTGRTSCIQHARLRRRAVQFVIAVPSHGSNFMHPGRRCVGNSASGHCSTLTRVELHASYRSGDRSPTARRLQYPHTGRTSCIRCHLRLAVRFRLLQYPHTGRTSCIMIFLSALDACKRLQYPHTGRTSCIHPHRRASCAVRELQYPHTGRTSCIIYANPHH